MTSPDLTEAVVILDRSGSMTRIKADTEGGFDHFIDQQRAAPGLCRLTLVQFDNEYDVVYTARPISDVDALVLKPRGSTALLDAIGRTITATGERLAAMAEDDRPGKVIFVIITDGEENSSREFTLEQINTMITHQTEVYGWDFVYLGANQDAITVAKTMGINTNSSLTYSGAGTSSAYSAMSGLVTRTRAGGRGTFTEEDRESAVK